MHEDKAKEGDLKFKRRQTDFGFFGNKKSLTPFSNTSEVPSAPTIEPGSRQKRSILINNFNFKGCDSQTNQKVVNGGDYYNGDSKNTSKGF
jgi:hypothetical protein